MKKAYNPEWIQNLEIIKMADSWFEKKLISEAQLMETKSGFAVPFYNPGIFVKIGLFLFTLLACSFFGGFLSMFFLGMTDGDGALTLLSIAAGCSFVFALELLIRDKKLYHSGVDNALLYSAIAAFTTPYFLIFTSPTVAQSCFYILIILAIAHYRYADAFIAMAGYAVLFTLLANLMMKFSLGAALLPFGIMAASAIVYFFADKARSDYYAICNRVFKVLSLVTFYLGGNYYAVREGNALLNDLPGSIAPQISFAPLFYFFTLAIPVLYVVAGLKTKDRILFITGLLAIAFSVFTYRYYFAFLPIEQGLALAGILMMVTSVSVIRYLKTTKHGLTDDQDGKRKLANLEALIIAQQVGQTPQERGVEFGQGNFGGAGAGDGY